MSAVCCQLAQAVTMLAADGQQEVHELGAAGVDRTGEQEPGVGALEGGGGRLLQITTTARKQATLHLHKVWQEHSRGELVADKRLKRLVLSL